MRHRVWMAMLVVWLLAGFAPDGVAQQEVDEQKVAEFWRRYTDARNLNDQRTMQRVMRNSKKEARYQYTVKLNGWAKGGDPQLLEDLESLATTWELTFGDSKLREQVDAFKELSEADRERLGKAREEYDNCVYLFNKAQTSRKQEDVQEAIDKLRTTGETFADLSDFEYAGHCFSMLARSYQQVMGEVSGEQKEQAQAAALDAFQKTREYYQKAGWTNDMPWVEQQIAALKASGEEQPPAGGEGAAADTGDEKAKSDEDSGWTTIEMSYVGRDPSTRWDCPDYSDGEEYFLWPSLVLRDTEGFKKELPFGGATMVRDGAQYYIDDDSDGQTDREIRIGNSPRQIDFVLGKGDDSVEYTTTMQYGNQTESHFGISDMNFQPTQYFTQLFYRRACYMEGELDGESIVIIDDNNNGEYALPMTGWTNPRNNEEMFFTDAIVVGKRAKKAVPLGNYFLHDEKLYQIKIALNGSSIQVKEMPGVKFGTAKLEVEKLRAKPSYVVIRNLDTYKGALFDISQERRGLDVPAGKYEIAYGVIEQGKGRRIQKIQILKGKSEPFEIVADEEHEVVIGGPFEFDDFVFSGAAGRFLLEAATIKVYGTSGELYTLFYDEPPLPTVAVRSGNRVVVKGEEMKAPVRDDYHQNALVLWTGLDFQTQVAGEGPYQVKLMARHPILGPIVSDWKSSN